MAFQSEGVFLCTSLINHIGTDVLQLLSVFHVSFLTVHAQQPQLLRSADHRRSHGKLLQQSPTGSLGWGQGQ